MRKAPTACLFALLAVATALAQNPTGNNPANRQPQSSTPQSSTHDANQPVTPAPSPNSGSPTVQPSVNPVAAALEQLAAGSEIRATLDTPLSTRTSKPGDRFTATIAEPARGRSGEVVVPAGARVEGEVAELDDEKTMTALRDKGALNLRFRDVVLPDGQTLALTATLISVNDTSGKTVKKSDEETHRPQAGSNPGTNTKDIAGNTGVSPGSSAGTPVFGSPLKGLAIGALSGGGYVLSTKGKVVNLPAQTGMVIRLDQPLTATAAAMPPQ